MKQFRVPAGRPFSAFFTGVNHTGAAEIRTDGKLIYRRDTVPAGTLKVNFFDGSNMPFGCNFNYQSVEILPLQTIPLPSLPAPERNREKEPHIITNPKLTGTPARIYSELGVIELSDAFYKLHLPYRVFILFHEYGHFFYSTEWKADAYAFYHFIKRGGNPSTAVDCLVKILKLTGKNPAQIEQNINRIKTLFNIAK